MQNDSSYNDNSRVEIPRSWRFSLPNLTTPEQAERENMTPLFLRPRAESEDSRTQTASYWRQWGIDLKKKSAERKEYWENSRKLVQEFIDQQPEPMQEKTETNIKEHSNTSEKLTKLVAISKCIIQ